MCVCGYFEYKMPVKRIFIIYLSLSLSLESFRKENPWVLFTLLVSVTFHKVVVAAVFCNYKSKTPTTINIETVRKLNTRIRRTDKKAKQPDDARQQQQQQQRGATTTAERQSNSRRGNAIGNTNVNKPEIQISINFPSLRTHAGAHTRATHIRTHTHTTILAYVAFNFLFVQIFAYYVWNPFAAWFTLSMCLCVHFVFVFLMQFVVERVLCHSSSSPSFVCMVWRWSFNFFRFVWIESSYHLFLCWILHIR